jgi:hypothetical protein
MLETESLPLQRPVDTAALVALLAQAVRQHTQVHIQGSGSLPLSQADPARPAQTISTLRLNQVIEHATSDMTVIVQAGITLDALQTQLGWHNQWLPIDPPGRRGKAGMTRTLGGLIATNALGPLRHSYGDWRNFILGMRFVDGTGTLIRGGGRTVKNVAGYNTPRLMIGAAGTLGAIAEVTLRTYTRPADEQALVITAPNSGAAETLLAQILTAPLEPAYVELISPQTWQANPQVNPQADGQPGWAVVVGFMHTPELCASQIATVQTWSLCAAWPMQHLNAAQAGRLRLSLTNEPEAPLAFRLQCQSSQLSSVMVELEARAGQFATPIWMVAEVAGTLRVAIPQASSPQCQAWLDELFAHYADRVIITEADPKLGWTNRLQAESDLYQRLKTALDPQGILGHFR